MNNIGSYKNIWHGYGRQRIELSKSVLRTHIQSNEWLKQLYICGIGYYPHAQAHYSFRRHGLAENLLVYCEDGMGWYALDNQRYNVGPNEFFILPAHVKHSYGSYSQSPWSIYWLHFGGDALTAFNSLECVNKHFTPHLIKNNVEILSTYQRIFNILQAGFREDNLVLANLCFQSFLSLFIPNNRSTVSDQNQTPDIVDKAIEYMEEHLQGNLSLADICKHSNYSPSRFSHIFHHKTGYAPIDYYIHLKIRLAAKLLDETKRSVKDIALSMGFTDPYYFSKRFKKATGMSPLKYRTMNQDQLSYPSF